MNAFEPPPVSSYVPRSVDKDNLIDVVHALQVDLSMFASWIGATPAPELAHVSLESLTRLQHHLRYFVPGLNRH